MENISITFPKFHKPKSAEDAIATAKTLTGQFWKDFSPLRPVKTAGIGLGGQAFLAKRVKGHEWLTSQSLSYLCGQKILTPTALFSALGRKVIQSQDGGIDVKLSGDIRSNPSPELVETINLHGVELFPVDKYVKVGEKPYDKEPPNDASDPYIYVIEDELGDIKIGISIQPKSRFRSIERLESTNIVRFECLGPTSNASKIESQLLMRFNAGKHPRKTGREWVQNISFEEVSASLQSSLS